MISSQSRETSITLPAHARRGFGRDASWTVTLSGGLVNASAPTMGEAKTLLAERALEYVNHSVDRPAFAVDDDGSIVVAMASGSGTAAYRIRPSDGHVSGVAFVEGSPSEYIASVHHLRAVGAA